MRRIALSWNSYKKEVSWPRLDLRTYFLAGNMRFPFQGAFFLVLFFTSFLSVPEAEKK